MVPTVTDDERLGVERSPRGDGLDRYQAAGCNPVLDLLEIACESNQNSK
jgi:hypothetical protein